MALIEALVCEQGFRSGSHNVRNRGEGVVEGRRKLASVASMKSDGSRDNGMRKSGRVAAMEQRPGTRGRTAKTHFGA
jgi:hypothetical protein